MNNVLANVSAIIGVLGMLGGFIWIYIRANYGDEVKGVWMLLLFPVLTPFLIVKEWKMVKEPAILLFASVLLTIGAYTVGW